MQFLHRQVVRIVQLVPAHAVHRAAAMVPENQRVLVRRIFLRAEGQQRRQRLAGPHAHAFESIHHAQGIPERHIDAQRVRRQVHLPGARPAGHHQQVDLFRVVPAPGHFQQVRRGGAAAAFQIAAAHIDHQGDGFFRGAGSKPSGDSPGEKNQNQQNRSHPCFYHMLHPLPHYRIRSRACQQIAGFKKRVFRRPRRRKEGTIDGQKG